MKIKQLIIKHKRELLYLFLISLLSTLYMSSYFTYKNELDQKTNEIVKLNKELVKLRFKLDSPMIWVCGNRIHRDSSIVPRSYLDEYGREFYCIITTHNSSRQVIEFHTDKNSTAKEKLELFIFEFRQSTEL